MGDSILWISWSVGLLKRRRRSLGLDVGLIMDLERKDAMLLLKQNRSDVRTAKVEQCY